MAVITDSLLVDILLTLLPLLYFVYWIVTKNADYWDNRGVSTYRKSLLLNTYVKNISNADSIIEIYKMFPEHRFTGFVQLTKPFLVIRDADLINKILVKDFTHFQDRGGIVLKKDPFAKNLFVSTGQKWRNLRYKLTPTFTSGKLKGMFDQVSKSGDNMVAKIEELTTKDEAMDSKPFMFEFTLDVIASCAFGVQFEPKSQEFITFKNIILSIFDNPPLKVAKTAVVLLMPKIAEILGFYTLTPEASDYITNLTNTTLKFRKDNNIKRNDYFQLLLTLKEQEESGVMTGLTTSDASEDDAVVNQMKYAGHDNQMSFSNEKLFTEETIASNLFIFLSAGSESTANTISFVLFELTQHPDIQQRLQQEVDSALAKHGGWSYEAVKDMTYLDQVIQETQRLFPILPMLFRECVEPYKVPDSDLVIEKGVKIFIPVMGLHMDPKYYPDPERFDPERFADNNFKPNSAYLPFGDGPRICIAMRFAVMELKTCISRIMSQYSVKLSDKTKMPLKFIPRSLFPAVEGGIWLTFEKRKKTPIVN